MAHERQDGACHPNHIRLQGQDRDLQCSIKTRASLKDLAGFVAAALPSGDFRRIFVKPNWVMHQERAEFPISAMVTSSELIEAVVDACLEMYSAAHEIVIGDVPLQSCSWPVLSRQAGIMRLAEKYRDSRVSVSFRDLRRERFDKIDGYLQPHGSAEGDPKGYADVVLEDSSFLDEIADDGQKFRVTDYSPRHTTRNHSKGFHRYLIARSALECDLFVNIAKMKTHQKTGVTGALKNLVGINGDKANLVHFRAGTPADGGDEFPPGVPAIVRLQSSLRSVLQKRTKTLFRLGKYAWKCVRPISGIEILGTPERLGKAFYIAGGSWPGNDTIWRMVYDLNRIVLLARGDGKMCHSSQRAYVALLDGLTAGEGNGPLQPIPVSAGVLASATDPFLMDMCMAAMMGFDYRRIPLLSNYHRFQNGWASFEPESVRINVNGEEVCGIDSLAEVRQFTPPPGWHSIRRFNRYACR